MRIRLPSASTGFDGFQQIVQIEQSLSSSTDLRDEISMEAVSWLDANMCAPLGAVLSRHSVGEKAIRLSDIASGPREIMQKNGFLQSFGFPSRPDSYATTIEYRRFGREDREEFQRYIADHFRPGSRGLPRMSEALLREFRRSLFEIFWNSVEHSETRTGIFACGQFYPRGDRLDFSIADLGVGIKGRVQRDLGVAMAGQEAIIWALQGNTTRRGQLPGGLGLTLIQEFVNLNRGRLIVVSNEGYWEDRQGMIQVGSFGHEFPGTVVTIEVNTADMASYRLSTEVNADDIF